MDNKGTSARRMLQALFLGAALTVAGVASAQEKPFWEVIGLTDEEWASMSMAQRQLLMDLYEQDPNRVLASVAAYRKDNPLPEEPEEPPGGGEVCT